MSVIAPADTGNYEAACNTTHPPPLSQCHFPFPLRCAGWPEPYTLGTFKSFHHIILGNEKLWDGLSNCTSSVLLSNFARLFGTVQRQGATDRGLRGLT